MPTVFIMAAGEQSRWPRYHIPKQMLEVGQETILQRQIRQVNREGLTPFVVTHRTSLTTHAFASGDVHVIKPKDRRWLAESILSTQHEWEGPLIFLLGDVIFSKAAIDRVLRDHKIAKRFHIFGNNFECFALTAQPGTHQALKQHLRNSIAHAMQHPDYPGNGKLWTIYRLMMNISIERHVVPGNNQVFRKIQDDVTQDMDTPQKYRKFREHHLANGLLDDLP